MPGSSAEMSGSLSLIKDIPITTSLSMRKVYEDKLDEATRRQFARRCRRIHVVKAIFADLVRMRTSRTALILDLIAPPEMYVDNEDRKLGPDSDSSNYA